MDAEVLRVVMEIAAFFALAGAGISGFRFAGFGMAALGVALAVAAGGTGAFRGLRVAARRVHLLAAVAMAFAVASFGAFTVIVAPPGDQYGI